jgi:hypothetical protein
MKGVVAISGPVILILAVAGCGAGQGQRDVAPRIFPSRSILYAGQGHGDRPKHVVSDAEAKHDVRVDLRRWHAMLAQYKGGGLAPALTPRQFRHRLAAAASRYRFTVKHLRFVHARALAPLVVIQTRHYLALARATAEIVDSLDPQVHARAGQPCTRTLGNGQLCAPSELLFFEVQDERGVPFIALGMGQWARSEELYPFTHG